MSGPPTRARRTLATWRAWTDFLRAPRLPDRADLAPVPALAAVFPLYLLDLAIMAALFGALGVGLALGFTMPEHMLGEMTLTSALVAAIVLAAPLGEELAFRGWLSGRPGHVAATLALLAGGGLFVLGGGGAPSLLAAAGGLALALALAALYAGRKRPSMGWFQRYFAWFFWASAVLFAAVHLTNFASAGVALLPLVLPQFVLALLLGYLRVTHGLWSSVLLHMLHNATFIALVFAGST